MFGMTDIVTCTIAAAVLVALPGPDSMLCMAIAAQRVQKGADGGAAQPQGPAVFPSMMVQPVDARYPHPVVSFLVLGLFFQTLSLIYLNLMAPAASRISRFAARNRKSGAVGKGSVGAMFLAFAAKLWTA